MFRLTPARAAVVTAMAAVAAAGAAKADTEITVQYAYGYNFNDTFNQIGAEFSKQHPDIRIRFRGPYESYEDATQKVLREAITNQLPDVTFQGLNQIRLLVDRGIAVPLDGFIQAEEAFEKEGFHQAMFDIGTLNGKVYALPFAVSMPVTMWNLDLVKKAGGDPEKLPASWDEVVALALKIEALEPDINGVTYAWDITGNWMWQALVFSQGGDMMDAAEKTVTFDGPEGRRGIDILARLTTEAKMPAMTRPEMRSAFGAGKTGIHITSSSGISKVTEMVAGKFAMSVGGYPEVKPEVGRLPAGGNAAMIVATDDAKGKAAWQFVKFATGPLSAAIVAKTTGYMPPNRLADRYLETFYAENPNHLAPNRQLSVMTKWYAFPGPNGLKIIDVVKDQLNSIISGQRAQEPGKVLANMSADVKALLP